MGCAVTNDRDSEDETHWTEGSNTSETLLFVNRCRGTYSKEMNIEEDELVAINKIEYEAKICREKMQRSLEESGLYEILRNNNINLDSLKQDLREDEIDDFSDELNLTAKQRKLLMNLLCEINNNEKLNSRFNSSHQMELVMIGDSGVGKTSLVRRYIQNKFQENMQTTIGVDTMEIEETISDDTVMGITIWDTAGQERFHSVCHRFYKNADAIIVCFDVMNDITLEHCSIWIQQINEYGQDDVIVLFVGCKGDLSPNSRQVVETTAQTIVDKYGKLYCECSAKTGDNVRNVFLTAAELVMRKRRKHLKIGN